MYMIQQNTIPQMLDDYFTASQAEWTLNSDEN